MMTKKKRKEISYPQLGEVYKSETMKKTYRVGGIGVDLNTGAKSVLLRSSDERKGLILALDYFCENFILTKENGISN